MVFPSSEHITNLDTMTHSTVLSLTRQRLAPLPFASINIRISTAAHGMGSHQLNLGA
jgi:hypothetical protein